MADVIVIGAGIVGLSCAFRLAQTGLDVLVLERNAPASGASQAALGVLTFHASPEKPASLNRLHLASCGVYADFSDELQSYTGVRIEFGHGGGLSIALVDRDIEELERTFALNKELAVEVERVDRREMILLESGLSRQALAGIYFPHDSWVDNTALTLLIAQAAEKLGVVIERAEARRILTQGGRTTGVQCENRSFSCNWIILAAGCWSGTLGGLPKLPVGPAKGQALSVEGRIVRRVVESPRCYLVPKGASQTMVGATVERAGFDTANTPGGLAEICNGGQEISPRLGDCPFVNAWAGLRPVAPDELPVIGPFSGLPNVLAATGHFRNGILLAPITAQIVKALVAGEDPLFDISQFLPDRDFASYG